MNNKMTNYRWTVVSLLFFATTINYLDRQVLSLLYPLLQEKFSWTNSQYADIAAAFQFTYAVCLLFAGRVIDKLGTKNGYSLAIIVWSIGAVIHAYANPIGEFILTTFGWLGLAAVPASVLGFIFARAFLALGEAGNFPAAIKVTAEYFPKKERSFATGIFNSGANVGAVLAPLSVPWIAKEWGWELAFIIIGAIGFIWLFFWFIYYAPPREQKRLSKEELSYIQQSEEGEEILSADPNEKVKWTRLFGYKQTWAFSFGKFGTLQHGYDWIGCRRMVPSIFHQERIFCIRWSFKSDVYHCTFSIGRFIGAAIWRYKFLGSNFIDWCGCFCSPGMECQHIYNSIRYVSK